MEFDLKDLVQTLAVGAFVLHGCSLWWQTVRKEKPNEPKRHPLFAGLELHHTAVYVALSLAMGIIVEGVCNQLFAEKHGRVVVSNDNARLENLFKNPKYDTTHLEGKPRPVFRELVELSSLPPHVEGPRRAVTNKLVTIKGNPFARVDGANEVEDFREAVDKLFFTAKNRAFREPTYNAELMDIHRRIVFTRAFVTACLGLSAAFFVLAPIVWRRRLTVSAETFRDEMWRVLLLGVLYGAGYGLGWFAYNGERKDFDTRAVGYYISIRTEPGTSANSE